MVGGEPRGGEPLEPIFKALAPPEGGYVHCGPPGAGHYTKMVHNGIEYGLMQAYAEGFEIMHASEYPLDLEAIAKAWMHGTVIRSWLLELAGRAFEQHGTDLADIRGWVADSGEGRWTVQEAIDLDVPAPVITLSLLTRFREPPGRELLGAGPGRAAPAVRRPRRQDASERGDQDAWQRHRQERRAGPASRPTPTKARARRHDAADAVHVNRPDASRRTVENPLRAGLAPGARPRAVLDRHLRRHRRPDLTQDPARDLQPAPSRAAAARDDRASASRAGRCPMTTSAR